MTLPDSREVVLEYIVERKRMDDLAGSITDGRFNEQKVLSFLNDVCKTLQNIRKFEVLPAQCSTACSLSLFSSV